MNTKELLKAIKRTYGRDVFELNEIYEILNNCDYSHDEARRIILDSLNDKHLGHISLRRNRNRLPARTSFVAIMADINKELS